MGKPQRNSKQERRKVAPVKPDYKANRDAAKRARDLAMRRDKARRQADEDEL